MVILGSGGSGQLQSGQGAHGSGQLLGHGFGQGFGQSQGLGHLLGQGFGQFCCPEELEEELEEQSESEWLDDEHLEQLDSHVDLESDPDLESLLSE